MRAAECHAGIGDDGAVKEGGDGSEASLEQALRLAATARVARLATLEPDGRVQLVPIVFVLHGSSLYTAVDQKPKRAGELRRMRNVREREDVAVIVDSYSEEWSELWWVRLRGRGRVLAAGPEAEEALRLLVEKYEQYRTAPPRPPVLAVDVAEARVWQAV